MSDMPPPPPSAPPPPPSMSPPPGYVAYGGPGSHHGDVQRIGGLCKATVVLLCIYLPLQVVVIFDQVRLSRRARDLLDGTITEQSFRDSVQLNASSIIGLLVVPIAVLTMIWMYRMASNLRALGRTGQTWAPGWGIAAWFVPPCVIYAVPWLMFRELWKGSDPACPPGNPDWKRGAVSPLITVWWVLYGLVPLLGFFSAAGLVGQFRGRSTMRDLAETLEDFGTVNVVFTLVGMAATAVYALIVRQLSGRHMQATGEA